MIDPASLMKRFHSVRTRTADICAPLSPEDHIPQPFLFASPPKWHLGHTTWFFEAFILKKFASDYREFHPSFDYVFNSYYNGMGERILRDHRGNLSRPLLREVHDYRNHVNEAMIKLMEDEVSAEVIQLIVLGLNHEEQHQELLLTDIKAMLSANPLKPMYRDGGSLVSDTQDASERIEIEEGVYEIGVNPDEDSFCYDNETSRHRCFVAGFKIDTRLLSNEAVIAFIEDGGYRDHRLWLDEGWSWVNTENIQMPMYWERHEDGYQQFTLGGVLPVNPSAAAAHISHYEASAIAQWLGRRLPTEMEWEVASSQLEWGARWEHTNSAYLPYPGFEPAPGAVGEYNGKFMMNQMVLRGGSPATAPGHSRPTYRNFFHPQMQWQFSGVRLISND